MTLEEKIVFYSRESAAEFQKYLRQHNCGSRIAVDYTFSGEPYFEGSISSFMGLFEKFVTGDSDNSEEADALKTELEERRDTLAAFLAAHKAGDVVTDATPSQLLAQLESIDATSDEAIHDEAAKKFVSALMVLATLEDNELLESAGDDENLSYTLTDIKPADELTIMYDYDEFMKVDADDLKDSGIINHIRTSSSTEYCVTIDADVLYLDMDEVVEYLDSLDIDADELGRFADAVFFKQMLVATIRGCVAAGAASEAAICDALNAPSFPLEETNDLISYDVSPDYVRAVVSDLRKLGVLSGKDGKIKSS